MKAARQKEAIFNTVLCFCCSRCTVSTVWVNKNAIFCNVALFLTHSLRMHYIVHTYLSSGLVSGLDSLSKDSGSDSDFFWTRESESSPVDSLCLSMWQPKPRISTGQAPAPLAPRTPFWQRLTWHHASHCGCWRDPGRSHDETLDVCLQTG